MTMTATLIIEFTGLRDGGDQVVIEYRPITPEAGADDRLAAVELALHALAQDAIRGRQEGGMAVPEVFYALEDACTYKELY